MIKLYAERKPGRALIVRIALGFLLAAYSPRRRLAHAWTGLPVAHCDRLLLVSDLILRDLTPPKLSCLVKHDLMSTISQHAVPLQ